MTMRRSVLIACLAFFVIVFFAGILVGQPTSISCSDDEDPLIEGPLW